MVRVGPGVRSWLATALAATFDPTDRLRGGSVSPSLEHTPLEYTQMVCYRRTEDEEHDNTTYCSPRPICVYSRGVCCRLGETEPRT